MIGYFDPASLKVNEAEGEITFVNAADGSNTKLIRMNSTKDAKKVLDALKDQLALGMAGTEGRFMKVQGTFSKVKGRNNEGIIIDPNDRKETPVRMGFDVAEGELPNRAICIAIGEMVDGALIVERISVAPIAPTPSPNQGMSAAAS